MSTQTTTTSRAIAFRVVDHRSRKVTEIRTLPAGTRVYVTSHRATGTYTARVCGTLLEQQVRIGDFQHA